VLVNEQQTARRYRAEFDARSLSRGRRCCAFATFHPHLHAEIPMNGQEVPMLVNEQQTAGRYRAEFDARSLSSGTYLSLASLQCCADEKDVRGEIELNPLCLICLRELGAVATRGDFINVARSSPTKPIINGFVSSKPFLLRLKLCLLIACRRHLWRVNYPPQLIEPTLICGKNFLATNVQALCSPINMWCTAYLNKRIVGSEQQFKR